MGKNYLSTGAGFRPSTVAAENGWLEDEVSFWGPSLFSGAFAVSFRECIFPIGRMEDFPSIAILVQWEGVFFNNPHNEDCQSSFFQILRDFVKNDHD